MKYIIPESLLIGGFQYEVERSDLELESKGCYADSSNFLKRIRIRENVPNNGDERLNSFLHEILHCVDYVYLESTLTEDQVRVLANGLHQIFRQL